MRGVLKHNGKKVFIEKKGYLRNSDFNKYIARKIFADNNIMFIGNWTGKWIVWDNFQAYTSNYEPKTRHYIELEG